METKQYIPHKLRSRPLRCIALPAICTLIFIAYWFILCPLIYVIIWNDYNHYYAKTWPKWWTFAFWAVAFGIFVIIMLIIVLIWRCIKQKEKAGELAARKNEYDTLLTPRNSTVKELYHVSLINDKSVNSKEELKTDTLKNVVENNKRNTIIELNNRISQIGEKSKNEDKNKIQEPGKEFAKCSVKKRPELNLEKARPLSQVSNLSLPRSPLTPRDLFFIDLIQAAAESPTAFIQPTETFLDNERKNYLPEIPPEAPEDNPPVKMRNHSAKFDDPESEYFIANVPDRKSLTAEVFIFVDGGEAEKEFQITMCSNNDDVFVD